MPWNGRGLSQRHSVQSWFCSGLAHLLLGSVAEYVVRNSKVPVLTVGMHVTQTQT